MFRLPFALGLIALVTASSAFGEIARIKQSSGAAVVQRGSQQIRPAPGLQLLAGDRLVTGKDGRMSLTFVDNTRYAVGPNSSVAVGQFQYDRMCQSRAFLTQVDPFTCER